MTALAQKTYGEVRRDPHEDPLERVLFLILADRSTPEKARKGRESLERQLVDLNEMRVTSVAQIAEVIDGVGYEEDKATILKRFLERLFNHQHCISFDFFRELTPAGARAYLEESETMPHRIVVNLMMRFFGEGVLPVDAQLLRVVQRVGVFDRVEMDLAESMLTALVPKRQVFAFHELMHYVAHDACLVSVKHCDRCPLASICKTAKTKAVRKPKAKPKKKAKPNARAKAKAKRAPKRKTAKATKSR